MHWVECQSCWAEFRVVSDVDESINYCPYCGADVEATEDEEEQDYSEE